MTAKKSTENTAVTSSIPAALGSAKETLGNASTALNASGKAYVQGIFALGGALGGIGREAAAEVGRHVKATIDARSMREVAELQAAWAQDRVETATAHVKEFADLAREKSDEVIAPIAALIKQDKAA